jgi:hypothetical protein
VGEGGNNLSKDKETYITDGIPYVQIYFVPYSAVA